ncbi:MAG: FkbM family methyltransferase, partial [Deltaproteobacteria bacterium]|nr:FkbM family methyltransferase [Deltaproteobacteria bacterium]
DDTYLAGMKYVPGNLGSPFLDRSTQGGVAVRTLDSYDFNDLTLLKIDVEIHYMEVLRGALATLQRCRPVLIVEGNYDEIFPFLAPLGYAIVAYWKHYNTHCLLPLFGGKKAERQEPSATP